MRLGLFCLPAIGHLNPAHALSRRLLQRGHRVICFQTARAQASVRTAGLEFCSIDIGQPAPHYLSTPVSTMDFIAEHAERVLLARDRLSDAQVDALIVDHGELGAGTLAQHLGLPFVNIAFSIPFHLDSSIPPPAFPWTHRRGWIGTARNLAGNWLVERSVSRALSVVNTYRRGWRLSPHKRLNDVFSTRAVITQAPEWFDFPRRNRPPWLIHTGPFVDRAVRHSLAFPWERLDGRPLIYASLGTVRSETQHVLRTIAWSCAHQNVQLVLSLGGRLDPSALDPVPDNVIVVPFAPQLDLLPRAALMVTHAGLNSTLEALIEGVPLLAVPLADDQPGTAARIEYLGVGRSLRARQMTRETLWRSVQHVLATPSYRERAKTCGRELARVDGLDAAVRAIEQQCGTGHDSPLRSGGHGLADGGASYSVPA